MPTAESFYHQQQDVLSVIFSPESAFVLNLVEALGVGLLIGIERERKDQKTGGGDAAGLRTFALASLAGAVSMIVAGPMMLAVTLAGVILLRCAACINVQGPSYGLTTSVSLIIVVLLGGFSIEAPIAAAAIGVIVAVLLASRSVLHTFASTLTDAEVRDGLILASVCLVVLPILPNAPFGPDGLLNPQKIFLIVALVMGIGAVGHVATRVFGAKLGLPLSGFFSGFVSSAATIVSMGQRSGSTPNAQHAAAGAILSSVSSFIQITLVIAALSLPMLYSSAGVLLASGLSSAIYGAAFAFLALRHGEESASMELPRKVFSVRSAFLFAFTVTATLLAAALLQEHIGDAAIIPAAAIAGLVSTQSAAAALAALVAAGKINPDETLLPLLVAITANILVRVFLAHVHGVASFTRIVIIGLVISGIAGWLGWYFSLQQV